MTSPVFDLSTLQSWLQSLLTDAVSLQPGEGTRIEEVITASSRQTSRQRLEVYSNAYFARLLECLREEFATLCRFLGQDVFDSLSVAYLEAYPSRSYTLAHLGSLFPRFLEESSAAFENDASAAAEPTCNTQFLIDLAQLERIYAEVFDGPGIEGLRPIDASDLNRIDPLDWPRVIFEPAPCLRVVELAYPVHEFITACRQELAPPVPHACPTWLAVTRRQFVVRRVALTETQFRLLELLSHRTPMGDALSQIAGIPADLDSLSQQIEQWFHEWTAAGFFQAILPPASQ